MTLRDDTWRITADLRTTIDGIVDDEIRHLTRAWVRAWDAAVAQVDAAAFDIATAELAPTIAQIRRMRTAQRALRTVHTSIVQILTAAGVRFEAAAAAITAATTSLDAEIVASQLPRTARISATSFERVDARAVEAIVERTARQITAYAWPLADDAVEAMLRGLVAGALRGASPREVARDIVRNAEHGFNGGLARALNIARTELLDAHRHAAYLNQLANGDVLDGWMWTATLDGAICPSCVSKHGQVFPLEEPGPHDHQSGRCTRTPVTKSWAALGFDLREPASKITTGPEWFARQDTATQQRILGPGRYQLWKDGRISFGQLSTLRSTPGWRDSYVATPLKNLAA